VGIHLFKFRRAYVTAADRWPFIFFIYEHSEKAQAPHTHTNRGTCRCGALSLLQSRYTTGGFSRARAQQLFPELTFLFKAHEVSRAEELAERRLRVTAPITPGSRSMGTARGTYLLPMASWENTLMLPSCASFSPQD
jgi:hypothetical protein